MVLNCKEVRRQISNYLDNDISPEMRKALDAHLANCRHCTAILDGTHNVLVLIADDRVFPLPAGFSTRLNQRLRRELDLT
jgi:predicted anti-sigma-YlaC factor YlaD